jgi:hypothetical protein
MFMHAGRDNKVGKRRVKARRNGHASTAVTSAGRGDMVAAAPTSPPPAAASESSQYAELSRRIRKAVQRVVPAAATVAVVSKGDAELLELNGRQGWHFPQREDGVYAGFYPADSAAAIEHLESLRQKGASYLVLPVTAFWWMETYAAFARYLESNYQLALDDADVCKVFALGPDVVEVVHVSQATVDVADVDVADGCVTDFIHPVHAADLRALFDFDYYVAQAGAFPNSECALLHYLTKGFDQGHNPHPLFDTPYYLRHNPEAAKAKQNPLVHFVVTSVSKLQNPCPDFDTEYYYQQCPVLRKQGVNALAHYLAADSDGPTSKPNPLFEDRFYLKSYPDVKRSGVNPLVHFLSKGCAAGLSGSAVHRNVVDTLLNERPRRHLLRGGWRNGIVLLFADGRQREECERTLNLADVLGTAHHLRALTVLLHREGLAGDEALETDGVVLEDFRLAADIFRPSTLNLLIRSLATLKPLFAIASTSAVVGPLKATGVPHFILNDGLEAMKSEEEVNVALDSATRIVFDSSQEFHNLARRGSRYPVNVALLPYADQSPQRYVSDLLALVERDLKLPEHVFAPAKARPSRA